MDASPAIIRFDAFTLDLANRQLRRDGATVDLGSRYFDALALLVLAGGDLVTKDRFMTEVWRGVPVTDEALTQCIRSLRRALGDDAASPRFIATVPKHGYRFVGTLVGGTSLGPAPRAEAAGTSLSSGRIAAAATMGGAIAGLAGGLLYGLLLAVLGEGQGSQLVLSMVTLCLAVGMLGGAGVGSGMALVTAWRGMNPASLAAGGTVGGLAVGALGRLVGLDLFAVLAGVGLGPVTGLVEGAAVGLLAGGGCALTLRFGSWKGGLLASLLGATGGWLVALGGGRLMAGSLLLLDRSLAGSRIELDAMGALLGEVRFGPASLAASAALEAAVFVVCVALAARRGWSAR